jgi:hypothetical protein
MRNNMKTIQLEYEQIAAIVIAELKSTYDQMKKDYEVTPVIGIFHTDREKDKKEIKKYLKSLKRLIEWYGGKV